jgi:hypothetical protein
VIFDLDDADYLDARQTDQLIECCTSSTMVLAGSATVADWCKQHNRNTRIIRTGAPAPRRPIGLSPDARPPIVAWAAADPAGYPDDAAIVCETMRAVAARTCVEFWLFGARHDMSPEVLKRFTSLPLRVRTVPPMSYPKFVRTLGHVAVGLAPMSVKLPYNEGKSLGKVLAYLSARVALVGESRLELPTVVKHGVDGMLATTREDWIEQTHELIVDNVYRSAVASAGFKLFLRELTTDAVAARVDLELRRCLQ